MLRCVLDRRTVLPLILCLVALTVGAAVSAQSVDDFAARLYTDAQGNTLPYRLFIPANYNPLVKYPLVLFLHGSGGSGSDNRKQLTDQTAPLVFAAPENQANWPCFMLAPQCPAGELFANSWAGLDWGQPFNTQLLEPTVPMRLALEIAEALQAEFSLDTDRLYITGFSMGGFGTWDAITRYPGRFAAAIPICGGGDEYAAPRLVNMNVWAFHSDDDGTISVSRTRNMIAAMQAAGGTPRYTEYHGYGHFSWIPAYAESDLLPWLFAQTRHDPPPNQPPTVRLTFPANRALFPAPAHLPLTADAADSDGKVRKVDFYVNGVLRGTATFRPYSFGWNAVSRGSYTLLAVATDNGGGTTISAPVQITVLSPTSGRRTPHTPLPSPVNHAKR